MSQGIAEHCKLGMQLEVINWRGGSQDQIQTEVRELLQPDLEVKLDLYRQTFWLLGILAGVLGV